MRQRQPATSRGLSPTRPADGRQKVTTTWGGWNRRVVGGGAGGASPATLLPGLPRGLPPNAIFGSSSPAGSETDLAAAAAATAAAPGRQRKSPLPPLPQRPAPAVQPLALGGVTASADNPLEKLLRRAQQALRASPANPDPALCEEIGAALGRNRLRPYGKPGEIRRASMPTALSRHHRHSPRNGQHSTFIRSLAHLEDGLTNFFLFNYADLHGDTDHLHQILQSDSDAALLAQSAHGGGGGPHHHRHKSVASLHLDKLAEVKITSAKILGLLIRWDFNIFDMAELVGNRENTFVIVGDGVIQHLHSLITNIGMDHDKFISCLQELGEAYLDNPYHNCLHGADVAQALNWVLTTGGIADAFNGSAAAAAEAAALVSAAAAAAADDNKRSKIPDTTYLAALLAALAHDVGHVGLANNFLVATGDPLALLYNDHSPLEHMHASTLFNIMAKDKCNFLEGSGESGRLGGVKISTDTRKAMRGIIIDMILSTDMVKHGGLVGDLTARVAADQPLSSADGRDVQLVLNMSLHLADISNPARPTAVAVPWAKRIQEEFWAQGDLMREQEMPVPTMNDRAHAAENITHEARLQTGFTLGLVKPLFDLVNGIAGVDLTVPLQNIQKNLSVYAKLKDANLPMTMENIASVSPAVTAET